MQLRFQPYSAFIPDTFFVLVANFSSCHFSSYLRFAFLFVCCWNIFVHCPYGSQAGFCDPLRSLCGSICLKISTICILHFSWVSPKVASCWRFLIVTASLETLQLKYASALVAYSGLGVFITWLASPEADMLSFVGTRILRASVSVGYELILLWESCSGSIYFCSCASPSITFILFYSLSSKLVWGPGIKLSSAYTSVSAVLNWHRKDVFAIPSAFRRAHCLIMPSWWLLFKGDCLFFLATPPVFSNYSYYVFSDHAGCRSYGVSPCQYFLCTFKDIIFLARNGPASAKGSSNWPCIFNSSMLFSPPLVLYETFEKTGIMLSCRILDSMWLWSIWPTVIVVAPIGHSVCLHGSTISVWEKLQIFRRVVRLQPVAMTLMQNRKMIVLYIWLSCSSCTTVLHSFTNYLSACEWSSDWVSPIVHPGLWGAVGASCIWRFWRVRRWGRRWCRLRSFRHDQWSGLESYAPQYATTITESERCVRLLAYFFSRI